MSGEVTGASHKPTTAEGVVRVSAPERVPLREPYLVLIVDDEAPIAESLSYIVIDAGYTAMIATQGQEAFRLATDRWPALVFTDLMMPQMNGTKLIAALRAMAAADSHAMPPVVLMTAAGPHASEAADADVIIHKPFELAQIEELLFRFLGPPPA